MYPPVHYLWWQILHVWHVCRCCVVWSRWESCHMTLLATLQLFATQWKYPVPVEVLSESTQWKYPVVGPISWSALKQREQTANCTKILRKICSWDFYKMDNVTLNTCLANRWALHLSSLTSQLRELEYWFGPAKLLGAARRGRQLRCTAAGGQAGGQRVRVIHSGNNVSALTQVFFQEHVHWYSQALERCLKGLVSNSMKISVTVTTSRQLNFDETSFPDLKNISGRAAIGSDV